jgi:hypothetical protein
MPSRKNFPDVSSFFIFKVCKTPHLQIGHSFKKTLLPASGLGEALFFPEKQIPSKTICRSWE